MTYIHIGFQKTASTLIQRQVFSNLEGYTYLTPPYTQHDEAWNQMQYADPSMQKLQIKDGPESKLLISDEGLVGKPIFGGVNRSQVCSSLKKAYPDARILIVVRNQWDIVQSLHNQWVKGARKGTKTIGDYIWYQKKKYQKDEKFTLDSQCFNTNEDYLNLAFLNYSGIISLYKKHFSNVFVLPYELLLADSHEFKRVLETFLETSIDIDLAKVTQNKVNKSLEFDALAKKMIENALIQIPLPSILKSLIVFTAYRKKAKRQSSDLQRVEPIVKNYFRSDNQDLLKLLDHSTRAKVGDFYAY